MRHGMKVAALVLTLMLVVGSLGAAEPQPGKPPRRPQRGSLIWRVFSSLEEPERQELMKLQRRNPEEFRARMLELAEKQREEWQRGIDRQKQLIAAYRKSSDAVEREQFKRQLEGLVREEYMRILKDNRRMLAEMERRVGRLRRELAEREKGAAPAIEARLNSLLTGESTPELPPLPPPEQEGEGKPEPPPQGAPRPPEL